MSVAAALTALQVSLGKRDRIVGSGCCIGLLNRPWIRLDVLSFIPVTPWSLCCGPQFRAGGESHKGPVVSAQEAQAQAILAQARVSIDAENPPL